MTKRSLATAAALLVLVGLMACTNFSYYLQSVNGQLAVMSARRPVAQILAAPETDAALRERLLLAQELVTFAREQLLLENNGSYSDYADIERPFVVWNVVATPALSLAPQTWCFPFSGCVPYRGYFQQQDAQAFASELRAEGLDVAISGVPAYSTLGWFKDPLLNTFLFRDDLYLGELIFHELSHQKLYIKDHSDFNEAFAVVVAAKGLERWIAQGSKSSYLPQFQKMHARQDQFFTLFNETRQELTALYASALPAVQKQVSKSKIFAGFRLRYRELLESWGGGDGGPWLEEELNNARFASALTYRKLVPAFEALWLESGQSPERFYRAAEALAELPRAERQLKLEALTLR